MWCASGRLVSEELTLRINVNDRGMNSIVMQVWCEYLCRRLPPTPEKERPWFEDICLCGTGVYMRSAADVMTMQAHVRVRMCR